MSRCPKPVARKTFRTPASLLVGLVLTLAVTGLAGRAAQGQLREAFVDPVATDPMIRPLNELPDASSRRLDHFVAVDAGAHNGYLYVHLVGSGGLPENNIMFARHVAERGFHVVSLAYPNWPSVRDLTGQSGEAAAPGSVRRERLFGVDASDLVKVDAANGVVNRLMRLIEYLHQLGFFLQPSLAGIFRPLPA